MAEQYTKECAKRMRANGYSVWAVARILVDRDGCRHSEWFFQYRDASGRCRHAHNCVDMHTAIARGRVETGVSFA